MTTGRLLTILVKGRPAGYEHLLPFRFLQHLRTVQPFGTRVHGPLFGRLDSDDTAHVSAAIPKMARRVVLLAFEGELNRRETMDALGSNLISEF